MAGRLGPQFGVHQRFHADRSKALRPHQRGHLGLGPPAEQRQAIANPFVFVTARKGPDSKAFGLFFFSAFQMQSLVGTVAAKKPDPETVVM
jgi:hypothetical protein